MLERSRQHVLFMMSHSASRILHVNNLWTQHMPSSIFTRGVGYQDRVHELMGQGVSIITIPDELLQLMCNKHMLCLRHRPKSKLITVRVCHANKHIALVSVAHLDI